MQKWQHLLFALLCGIPSESFPQTEPGSGISFSRAREIILSRNTGLKSVLTEIEASKAGISQAGSLPNPDVNVELQNFGTDEIEATIGQTIELGGKRRLEIEEARNHLDAAQNIRDMTQLELEAEIIRRFIPIAAVSKKMALLDSMIYIAESTAEQIKRRVEAGAAKQADWIRAVMNIELLGLKRSDLISLDEQARLKFSALGGNQDTILMKVSGSISNEAQIPSAGDLVRALRNGPQLTVIDIEHKQLETQKRQLKAEIIPDLNLMAGYVRSLYENLKSPLVGFSIQIPLWNQNSAAQEQVELKKEALGESRENILRLFEAELLSLYSRLLEIDRKRAVLSTSTVPKAGRVYEMIREYYDAGNAGFLDLADSQSEWLKLKMTLLDLETERANILTDLMQMTSLHIQIVN